MAVIPGEDGSKNIDTRLQVEPEQQWSSNPLEWDAPNPDHPFPTNLAPANPTGFLDVPKGVKDYLTWRYGTGVRITVGGRFSYPSGSDAGYSYIIGIQDKDKFVHVADFGAESWELPLGLPPGYEGPMKKEYEAMELRNRTLPEGSKKEIFQKTLHVVHESKLAQQMHADQMKLPTNVPFEPLSIPGK